MQHDAEPQESKDGELVGNMVRNHGNAPSHWCDRGAFYPVWGRWNYPQDRGTRPDAEDAQPCAGAGAWFWNMGSCIGLSSPHAHDGRATRAAAPPVRARGGRHALRGEISHPHGSREAVSSRRVPLAVTQPCSVVQSHGCLVRHVINTSESVASVDSGTGAYAVRERTGAPPQRPFH